MNWGFLWVMAGAGFIISYFLGFRVAMVVAVVLLAACLALRWLPRQKPIQKTDMHNGKESDTK